MPSLLAIDGSIGRYAPEFLRGFMEIRHPETDDKIITELLTAIAGYQAFLVAYDLKLFERLRDRPLTIEAMAAALQIARRPAQAILSVCAALGLLESGEDGYRLTDVAREYLLADSPFYVGKMIEFDWLQNGSLYSFAKVKRAVLTDQSQAYEGNEIFQTHETQADRAREFTAMMHAHSLGPATAWIEKFDLSRNTRMLDIGGGSAIHSIAATRRWRNLRATVFDLPVVCRLAKSYIEQSAAAQCVNTRAGNMWKDEFPPADLHFYSDIFHDWSPEKCLRLAQKSFRSLPPGGRIILHAMLLYDDKSGPFAVAASGIAMLLWNEGQQYSGQELCEMLAEAGFVAIEVQATFCYWGVVSGIKPS
jgi:hypothetical protein